MTLLLGNNGGIGGQASMLKGDKEVPVLLLGVVGGFRL
jgi:hypothetical protein